MLRTILLLFVALAGPWVVHIAPVQKRLMALVGLVGVLLLWPVLVNNWAAKWWFWLALAVGIVSTLAVGGGSRGGSRRRPPPPPRSRRPRAGDMTEEIM